MRIGPRLALVGSGRNGLGLTSPWDCNVYLVEADGEALLIDTGSGLDPGRIMSRIEATGIDPARVGQALLTHSHADHVAGAAFFARQLGTRIACPAASAASLRVGDEQASGLAAARAAGGYPPDFRYPSAPVDREIKDGDVIRLGSLTITAVATPGHSYDHTSYLLHDPAEDGVALFGGDVLLTDGRVLLLATADCRLDAYATTIRRLAALSLRGLLPGHGAFTLADGSRAVAAAAGYFERLVPPPSLT
jgi:glyoxylase-like metal-dependent hydrolase (beta-lactamase superfamily II)